MFGISIIYYFILLNTIPWHEYITVCLNIHLRQYQWEGEGKWKVKEGKYPQCTLHSCTK
jgi:hypothetical protein